MGLFSSKPIIQIKDKKLTLKELHNIKTFKDAMLIAGYKIDNNTTLKIYTKNATEYINGYETFKVVDVIMHDNAFIYIRKLYGKESKPY